MKFRFDRLGKDKKCEHRSEEMVWKPARHLRSRTPEAIKPMVEVFEEQFGLFELWPNLPPEESNTILE